MDVWKTYRQFTLEADSAIQVRKRVGDGDGGRDWSFAMLHDSLLLPMIDLASRMRFGIAIRHACPLDDTSRDLPDR